MNKWISKARAKVRSTHFAGFPFQLFQLLDHQQARRVYSIPRCLRDEIATAFFAKYPTETDSRTVEAQSILESMAIVCEVDVSKIECGHATVREHTLQKGRGHFAFLPQVSAQLFCRFVGKQIERFLGSMPKPKPSESAQASAGSTSKTTSRRKRKKNTETETGPGGSGEQQKVPQTRGGGAWRAFLAEAAKGTKIDKRSLGRFSQMYHDLSHDEYERFREIGQVATMAARGGVRKPFANPRMIDQDHANHDQVVAQESTLAVLRASHQDVLVTLDGENFEERYASFTSILSKDRAALLRGS